MCFKAIHIVLCLSFSVLYPCLFLPSSTQLNFFAFLRFSLSILLFSLIHLNEHFFASKDSPFIKDYMRISRYLLGILTAYFGFNLIFYLQNFSSFIFVCSLFFLSLILLLYKSLLLRYGLVEPYLIFILTPSLMMTTQLVLYSDYYFDSVLNFAPCSFVFLGFSIIDDAKKDFEAKQNFSLCKLLGRQDSLRMMVLVFGYIYFALIWDAFVKKTLM